MKRCHFYYVICYIQGAPTDHYGYVWPSLSRVQWLTELFEAFRALLLAQLSVPAR